ncbi:hypothetical protein V5O48_011274 [Marasmius crinis-equi]|uniref:Uncharacterized protein n=1 Tax=Marasmius crinis-equi TaxID=585013 RepID=A0ABR3F629_9AGAR
MHLLRSKDVGLAVEMVFRGNRLGTGGRMAGNYGGRIVHRIAQESHRGSEFMSLTVHRGTPVLASLQLHWIDTFLDDEGRDGELCLTTQKDSLGFEEMLERRMGKGGLRSVVLNVYERTYVQVDWLEKLKREGLPIRVIGKQKEIV